MLVKWLPFTAFTFLMLNAFAGTNPPVSLFVLTRSELRKPPPADHNPSVAVALETPSADRFEARLQRSATMNGTPLLREPARTSSGFFQRAGKLVGPRGATLFGKNPNARRDPLIVDGW